jgi:hypothetical protein
MNKPIGGRGKKAPYQTRVLRIPEPIADAVQRLVDRYRDKAMADSISTNVQIQYEIPELRYSKLNYLEATQEMEKILKKKKGAKLSMQKLLQVLYESK